MLSRQQEIVTVFGGSGFLGQYVVRALAKAGYRVQVICRDAEAALFLKPLGDVGQIALLSGDISHPQSWQHLVGGSVAVINLVGKLFSKGGQTFENIHNRAPSKLAEICREAGVPKFIHVSALGVDHADTSTYAESKLLGENNIRRIFQGVTIFRPSVIFGAEDNFFNQFGQMASISPILPLIGGGKTKFQPVYVVNVADAIVQAVARDDMAGKIYELAGPDTYTFKELMQLVLDVTGQKARLVTIPNPIASLMGAFGSLLPKPPLTMDQVRLLKYHNVALGTLPGLKELGILPTSAMDVIPGYLSRFRSPVKDGALYNG